MIVILNTAFSSSWNEIAHGVPFSDSEMKFLKVDGVTGDRTKEKLRPREACQRATARFVALCHLRGTGKIVNPLAEIKI